ncbi:type II toxin-antitoxin system RelE/ParE family toxin [Methylocystis suflitae]|uniref:type II toxin-antitoxin system RelE/ParE family toxin n=1 Tax=Methylocystis suflitae TaxID=2951405 RepID=UPI0038990FEA
MIVVFAADAEADLERIGDYIAKDSPVTAVNFMISLRRHCEALAEFPKRFPLAPRYEHIGVRRMTHGDYLIFYRVGAEEVEIAYFAWRPGL